MTKDTNWKLRLSQKELADWKAQAAEEGVLLSEWIRNQCNGIEPPVAIAALLPSEEAVEAKPKVYGSRKVAQCAHGIGKGYNCWQCGGMAVLEK